jgi:SPP1 family predicted phage head-tail adaptor
MRAGRLFQRITFQTRSATQDSYGNELDSWTDLVTVWGACEPISGREFFSALQVNSEITARITVRYSPEVAAVTTKHRAMCEGKAFDIHAIIDPNRAHSELQMMCADHAASTQ